MGDVDWQYLLFDFNGRINRGKFWLGIGVMWAFSLVVGVIVGFILWSFSEALAWLWWAIVYIGLLWTGLALSVKRWHDRDKSGWWILIGAVPLVGGLWALIETGFLEGTNGPNEYGPDPLATD